MTRENQHNKMAARDYWRVVDAAPPEYLATEIMPHFAPGFSWQGPAPFTHFDGPKAMAEGFLAPLKRAFPDLRRDFHLFLGGHSEGNRQGGGDGTSWVAATGLFTGTQLAPFIGLPPHPRPLRLRWAEFLRFEDGAIAQSQMLIDFLDWFEQRRLRVMPTSAGAPFVYPPPGGFDGVLNGPQDRAESASVLDRARDLIFRALNRYDGRGLASMELASHVHPNFRWYGPSGMGAGLSLRDFEEFQQLPWLIAFPGQKYSGMDALIAEGRLAAGSGWGAIRATHAGPFLGLPATNRKLSINSMNFWLWGGERCTENWFMPDMIHLFGQLGVDLMAVARARATAMTQGQAG